MIEAHIKRDMERLLLMPEFRRFLWRVIQMGRIFDLTADGAEGRSLVNEARKDLVLEILADAELGQPAEHPDKIPILTVIQVLREEAQQQPPEKPNARRDRYDRTSELDDDE